MSRSIRKTSIEFGMVSVPVKVHKATETHDVGFHQHHAGCNGRIGYNRVCKDCEKPVEFADIIKGIEVGGVLVTVTKDELAALDAEHGAIEVVEFVDASEVDPISLEAAYYLEPDSKGKPVGYALLRRVLSESGQVAIVNFALRSRTQLGTLRVVGDVIVLQTVMWPDEVRVPTFASLAAVNALELDPKSVAMAHTVVESMVGKFDPAEHVDTYTERLQEMLETKAAGGEVTAVAPPKTEDVSDLIAMLEASIKAKGKKKSRAKK